MLRSVITELYQSVLFTRVLMGAPQCPFLPFWSHLFGRRVHVRGPRGMGAGQGYPAAPSGFESWPLGLPHHLESPPPPGRAGAPRDLLL